MRLGHLAFVFSVVCALASGASAQSPKPLDAVAKAAKALDEGRNKDALQAVEEAFKLGPDEELASRALLIRAQAYEKSGMPAQAMADYNSAIWLQSLPSSERKKAVDGLERMKVALGLSSARPASQSAAAPETSSGGSSSSGGGVANFFEGLFGGSSSSSSSAPAPAQQNAQPPAEGWSTRVTPDAATRARSAAASAPAPAASSQRAAPPEPRPERPAPARAAPRAEPTRTAAAVTEQKTGYDIDFGAAASQKAAQSQAKDIKAQLSDILVSRELTLLPAGGKVRIVAGPYQSEGAANALCRTIQARGVTCQVTER